MKNLILALSLLVASTSYGAESAKGSRSEAEKFACVVSAYFDETEALATTKAKNAAAMQLEMDSAKQSEYSIRFLESSNELERRKARRKLALGVLPEHKVQSALAGARGFISDEAATKCGL